MDEPVKHNCSECIWWASMNGGYGHCFRKGARSRNTRGCLWDDRCKHWSNNKDDYHDLEFKAIIELRRPIDLKVLKSS
jgi:hypothetical protein